MATQVLPHKIWDTVYERNVYTLNGEDGYMDCEYRMNGSDLERRCNHVGPASYFQSCNWEILSPLITDIPDENGVTPRTIYHPYKEQFFGS